MGFGSSKDKTVRHVDCERNEDKGVHVCNFEEKNVDKNETEAEAIIEVNLDENGQPTDTAKESGAGYDDDTLDDLKQATKNRAKQEARGGMIDRKQQEA